MVELECIVDSREQALYTDLQQQLSIPVKKEMLVLGDVVVQKQEGGEVLFLLERKTVRDLVHSLKDGRFHDQRKRWKEYRQPHPSVSVSVWIEGDLLSADMDETMRSSLLNALFRLQSKHDVIVHQVRTRDAFVKSLQMIVEKLEKDPYHLVNPMDPNATTTTTVATTDAMSQHRKSSKSKETYWTDCLALIPGVSHSTAQKITAPFPTMTSIIQRDAEHVLLQLSEIQISEKRRLGDKLAKKILEHICVNQNNKE